MGAANFKCVDNSLIRTISRIFATPLMSVAFGKFSGDPGWTGPDRRGRNRLNTMRCFAYFYDPKLITELKTSHILEYMCSLVDGPAAFSVFYWLPLVPTPMGGKFSLVIAPRAQAYPHRQRPWVIGSAHLASHVHDRLWTPGVHHAATARRGPPGVAPCLENLRP
jgi:hypothetical protein